MGARRKPTPFGRAIRIRLAELNMQQSDLARLIGTSEAYVTYLIYGDRRDEQWVAKICRALDMPLQEGKCPREEPAPQTGA